MEEYDDIIDLDFDEKIRKHPLASHGKRFIHALVDGFIFGILNNVVSAIFTPLFLDPLSSPVYSDDIDSYFIIIAIFSFIVSILVQVYGYALLEFNLKGKTVAKYITNTRVLTEDYKEPTFKHIHIRSWCRIIPFEPFSFLGKKPTGWHDSISKTIVIDESKMN